MTWQLVVYSTGAYSPDVHNLVCTPGSDLQSNRKRYWGGGSYACLQQQHCRCGASWTSACAQLCHCHHAGRALQGLKGITELTMPFARSDT